MKSRRIILTLEVDSTLALGKLRRAEYYDVLRACDIHVIQAQANVVRDGKKSKTISSK